jgi:hypothetical protein
MELQGVSGMIDTAKLRKLAEAATERPWFFTDNVIWIEVIRQVCCGRGTYECCGEPEIDQEQEQIATANTANIAFIAAACNAIIPLLDELERKTRALEDLIDVLGPCELPSRPDPDYHERVKALGRETGFGALMSTAECAWREVLEERGYPVGGEHASGPCKAVLQSSMKHARAALEGRT